MLKYIVRRLLMLIPVLLGVILVVFTLMYITPGDPVDSLLGDNATPEAREALREELGLNGGYFQRFYNYITRLLRGDMGICYATNLNVATRSANLSKYGQAGHFRRGICGDPRALLWRDFGNQAVLLSG